jgi:lysozyme family protein
MRITHDIVNKYFQKRISASDENVLTKEGFVKLADWCLSQWWWDKFAYNHDLKSDWRTSDYMNDPYVFALSVYSFLNNDVGRQ